MRGARASTATAAIQRTLGRNVSALREIAGMSQDELANRVGISRSHISRIEGALVNPTLATMATIAQALNTTIVDLLT